MAAGTAETSTRDPECPLVKNAGGTGPQVLDFQAVVWKKGQVRAVAPLAGDKVGLGMWINDNGQVGASGSCTDSSLPPLAFSRHAVLWESDGSATDLGTLGGTVDFEAGLGNAALSV